jgi:hypothetical protein
VLLALAGVSDAAAQAFAPIVVPLTKEGPFRFLEASVPFDVNGDGEKELVRWPEDGETIAFLALDRNGDGLINNGTELFGNFTMQGVHDGFSALLKLMEAEGPSTTRGFLEAPHPLYARLLLWQDFNRDGVSQPGELSPASNVLTAIDTGFTIPKNADWSGASFRWNGWAVFHEDKQRPKTKAVKEDGTEVLLDGPLVTRPIYDVVLAREP